MDKENAFKNDPAFNEFFDKYQSELTRLKRDNINEKDFKLLVTLKDFYNREMPNDVIGYLRQVAKFDI